ncbi:MAG: septum site-determining protein MinC [Eikenella sp.]|nr:septum site-determining protein MinC [Eikenella sp.]
MKPAFDIKSARPDALAVQLNSPDPAAVRQTLEERAAQYRAFADMPLLLDVQALDNPDTFDLGSILDLFARYGLRLGILRHADEQWLPLAQAYRLAFCGPSRSEEKSIVLPEAPAAAPPAAGARKTLVVERPIRTGQQVYAENADLIVLGMVSEGAEVIADGHIHVYAPLRGRALAGADGDRSARIFVQSMQAELVSVAGIYRTFDQDLPAHLRRKAVQVYLQEGRLVVAALGD